MTFTPGCEKPRDSGRRPGQPNRDTLRLKELVDRLGCDPIEVLARVAMGDAVGLGLLPVGSPAADAQLALPISLRVKAASELAGYIWPKRKALEVSMDEVPTGGVMVVPASMTIDEWSRKFGPIRTLNGHGQTDSTELTN